MVMRQILNIGKTVYRISEMDWMRGSRRWVAGIAWAVLWLGLAVGGAAQQRYLGFDRNGYPGDAALTGLRKSFSFAGYWLNDPPGTKENTWVGKRAILRAHGFGFLVLWNGRSYRELKGQDAAALGTADGRAAVAAAAREGFPRDVTIFLDQEEGGRLLAELAEYIFAWADAVGAGGARAGVYCSGMEVADGAGTTSTARDLVELEEKRLKGGADRRRLRLWVANDQCPPSPGCAPTEQGPGAGFAGAAVWQYALSPRRAQWSAGCPKNADAARNCYAPGMAHSGDTFVDLDVAESADPSGGR